jgi:hypothetical protein
MINRNGQQPDPSLLMEEEGDYDEPQKPCMPIPCSGRPVETARTVLDEPTTTLEITDTESGEIRTVELPTSHPVVRAMTDDTLKFVSRPRPARADAEIADGVMAWLDRETG